MNKENIKPKHTEEEKARLLAILLPYKGLVTLLGIPPTNYILYTPLHFMNFAIKKT